MPGLFPRFGFIFLFACFFVCFSGFVVAFSFFGFAFCSDFPYVFFSMFLVFCFCLLVLDFAVTFLIPWCMF